MHDQQRKLITVVTEAVIEAQICRELLDLGATGYTVTEARGSGSRGVRSAGWASSGNIRIEVICTEDVATRIIQHLRTRYYEDYAMVLFETDVGVLRPDKF